MLRYLTLTLILSLTFGSFSQEKFTEQKPINISYFGHFIFHPGLKVGTQYDFRTWTKRKEKKKGEKVKVKSFFMSPQVGMYVHSSNHTGLLINADVGYQRIKTKRGFYTAYSIGLGYLAQFNAGSTYEYQPDGTINQKRFASRSYFLPSINAEFGQKVNNKIGWFSKFTLGFQMPYNSLVIVVPMSEIGIKLNLGLLKD